MDTRRKNKGRKSKTEAEAYWPVRVRENKQAFWILLTDKEVDRAASVLYLIQKTCPPCGSESD